MSRRSCVLTIHPDQRRSFCSVGKALELVADGLGVITERKPGGRPSVIRLHAQMIRGLNLEWHGRISRERDHEGNVIASESIDKTGIPTRDGGGQTVMQLAERQ